MKLMKQAIVAMMMLLFAQFSFANMMSSDAKLQKLEAKMLETKTALAITPAQETQWKDYTTAVTNRAKAVSDEKMKMKTARQATPAPTAVQRMDQQVSFEKMNLKALEDQQAALNKLYGVLTPEQKTIADQKLKIK